MITSMHIENFKCFKDFDIELGPFNVLIGPNDSGKTAFLQAVRMVSGVTPKEIISMESLSQRLGFWLSHMSVWMQDPAAEIAIKAVARGGGMRSMAFSLRSRSDAHVLADVDDPAEIAAQTGDWKARCHRKCIGEAGCYRFDPEALRLPSLLKTEMKTTGEGLATFIDDLNRLEDRSHFTELSEKFRERFPHYTVIRIDKAEVMVPRDPVKPTTGTIQRIPRDAFVLNFRTSRNGVISAQDVSDGLMVSLAFMAIGHSPHPPNILLIEEPENHVHHASLKDIVATLKQLSEDKGVQVILTTHSPYLLDQVEPEEVHVFHKDDEGAVHTARLSDHPEVEGLKKHFMTGEIWTGFESDEDIVKKAGTFE